MVQLVLNLNKEATFSTKNIFNLKKQYIKRSFLN